MSSEEEIVINDKYPDQTVFIGRQLATSFKKKLQDLLKTYANVFAWTYADMTRILRTIMVEGKPFITEHKLNELKHMEPRKQKKRGLAPERSEALHKEVEEITKANILREVKYQTWVSNPIIIRKDEEKTAFSTREGVFCYKRLPFGLKNAGATYQRLVDKVFSNQIGQNLEVHVDDMVIKSDSEEDMLVDIQETFDKLRAINVKLNPRKCSFGVEEGPFLGYLITKKGIKANPSKLKAISDLKPPKTVKEIQSLNEKLVTLSRFLLKETDKTLPFLKVLKNCANKKIV
ncbi:reverse transcriptase domain-containing protein [Tanacetum coccineum]